MLVDPRCPNFVDGSTRTWTKEEATLQVRCDVADVARRTLDSVRLKDRFGADYGVDEGAMRRLRNRTRSRFGIDLDAASVDPTQKVSDFRDKVHASLTAEGRLTGEGI